MKSKAPLVLMEQLVMVLVFALSAAVCLQVFALSGGLSRTCEARDRAAVIAQNAAEALKACGGDYGEAAQRLGGRWDGQTWTVGFAAHWDRTEGEAVYCLSVTPGESGQKLLGMAEIAVYDGDEGELFSLYTAWQEVE